MKIGKFVVPAALIFLSIGAGFVPSVPGQDAEKRKFGLQPNGARPVAEKRIALVIGNGNYRFVAPLANPINDAREVGKALKELGFDVIEGYNQNQVEMKKSVRLFGEKLRGGGVGLFYYAGHGIQAGGRNYLIPITADIKTEEEIEYESVDVGFVLAQMETAKNKLNIVVLDACRNNPFARQFRSTASGLAQMNAPTGTLIAYATAPDSTASDGTGKNGLYTQELLRFMREPNLKVEDVFKKVRVEVRKKSSEKQVPWESSSLVGDFYFLQSAGGEKTEGTSGNPSEAVELEFWNSVKTSSNRADFEAYLKKFPNGAFADLAKNKLDALGTNTDPSPPSTSEGLTFERDLLSLETAFQAKGYAEVVSKGKVLLETRPDNPGSNRLVGLSYYLTLRPQESVPYLLKAVKGGEHVSFPIKHHHSGIGLSDDLCEGTLILQSGVLEFQSGGIGWHGFRVPIDKITELTVEPTKEGRLHVQLKLPKDNREEIKNYNFYSSKATLEHLSGSTSGVQFIRCPDCTSAMKALFDLLQQMISDKLKAVSAAGNIRTGRIQDLIGKVINAAGGLENIKNVKAVRSSGTGITYQPKIEKVTYTTVWTVERMLRVETESASNGKGILVFDGKKVWYVQKGKTKEAPEINVKYNDTLLNSVLPHLYLNLLDENNSITELPAMSVDGVQGIGFRVTNRNGDSFDAYFNEGTFLPVRFLGKAVSSSNKVEVEIRYFEFKKFNGLVFPVRQELYQEGKKVSEESTSEIVVNQAVEGSLFQKPSGK